MRATREYLQKHPKNLWWLLPHTAKFREPSVFMVLRSSTSQ